MTLSSIGKKKQQMEKKKGLFLFLITSIEIKKDEYMGYDIG
jgi:hypothetical protein